MPTIHSLKSQFLDELNKCRILYRHCLTPKDLHTEAGVEAAFLRMQTAWEFFLEEVFLAFLCGVQPLSAPFVSPYFTVADIEIARKILYQEREYCDWTGIDNVVIPRSQAFFGADNRIETALKNVTRSLQDIATIRNYIAHSSKKARDKFEKLCVRNLGGNPKLARAFNFLELPDSKNSPDTYFDTYTNILEATASKITD